MGEGARRSGRRRSRSALYTHGACRMQVEMIAAEAEEVALDLAGGKEITAREQQDMMWQSGSVSVWDLESVCMGAWVRGNGACTARARGMNRRRRGRSVS